MGNIIHIESKNNKFDVLVISKIQFFFLLLGNKTDDQPLCINQLSKTAMTLFIMGVIVVGHLNMDGVHKDHTGYPNFISSHFSTLNK